MDVTPKGLLKNWVPEIPGLVRTAVLAAVGRSPNAQHQDWITEVMVRAAQPVLGSPAALLKSQQFFKWDLPVIGRMWIARYTVPTPGLCTGGAQTWTEERYNGEEAALSIEEAVAFAIKHLAIHEDEESCPIPPFEPSGVEAEWTSYRPGAWPWSPPPSKLSPCEMYECAIRDVPEGEDSPVILYAHGGAFCLMDPANHRYTTSLLAQLTDSRVLNVRYRLSPQNIFPAALMDMFLVYLSLIAPPPGAFHKPVTASRIVLAGDSSGGNLVTALQLLLTTLIINGNSRIRNPWSASASSDNASILIPDPPCASLSLTSPWLDVTRSLPSQYMNSKYDFIAPMPSLSPGLQSTSPLFPTDSIWPSNPPRAETYCEARICAHQLVSPLMARQDILENFKGGLYVNTGWEGMSDECEVFVRKLWEARSSLHRRNAKHRSHLQSVKYLAGGANDSGYASSSSCIGEQENEPHPSMGGTDITAESDEHKSSLTSGSDRGLLVFDGYTAQPHTFSFLPFNRAGWKATLTRAECIRQSVHLKTKPSAPRSEGTQNDVRNESHRAAWTNSKTMKETQMAFPELGMSTGRNLHCGYERGEALTDKAVQQLVEDGRDFRVRLEERLRKEAAMRSRITEEKRLETPQSDAETKRNGFVALLLQGFGWIVDLFEGLVWTVTLLCRDWAFLFFKWSL